VQPDCENSAVRCDFGEFSGRIRDAGNSVMFFSVNGSPMLSLVADLVRFPVLAWVPGWMEMAIVLIICLVLFGNRLPGTMRSLGMSLTEFKKGMKEGESDDTGDLT